MKATGAWVMGGGAAASVIVSAGRTWPVLQNAFSYFLTNPSAAMGLTRFAWGALVDEDMPGGEDDVSRAGKNAINGLYGIASKVPQGLTRGEFEVMEQTLHGALKHISDDIVIQGSRAAGTAKATSDIDIAVKVGEKEFGKLIEKAFGKPNKGSAKERTMQRAIETGKIQAGEAGLSGLRKQLEKVFGMEVDISIIKQGGKFDNGTQIPVRGSSNP